MTAEVVKKLKFLYKNAVKKALLFYSIDYSNLQFCRCQQQKISQNRYVKYYGIYFREGCTRGARVIFWECAAVFFGKGVSMFQHRPCTNVNKKLLHCEHRGWII